MAAIPVAAAAQDGRERLIRVENHSNSSHIVSVRIANPHGRVYELLSPYTISPGYNRTLTFDDGEGHNHCVYNAQVTFANGTYALRHNVNVCVAYSWKVYDIDNVMD